MLKEVESTQVTPKLGAHWDGEGVHFALYSENAELVELCLFDDTGKHETARIQLHPDTSGVWAGYVQGASPGQQYGYRVHGPYKPVKGHLFNANKLLLDPYAYAITGEFQWNRALYAYRKRKDKLVINTLDNQDYMPKAVVVDGRFDWEDDVSPNIAPEQTVIYEMHVKGFTQQHPGVPPDQRGTYLGLTAPAVLEYLQQLGVTTLELLPCATAVTDQRLSDLELINYWGYDPIAMFAPDARFARNHAVHEFKSMVKALHKAGFEVVLDVVYNHTGEGNGLGPSLCFRGIDNAVYYRLDPKDRTKSIDTTGCGNSINVDHPRVLDMVLDCLRYWVSEMHVDGFRFDLATTIVRENNEFNPEAEFFRRIAADPILSKVKLIAEPWDLGYGGYRLGQFPKPWSEWNDSFRDSMRAFWKGEDHSLPDFARRFSGSSDIFAPHGKLPSSSINFITAHDGFTLCDVVSYIEKHNEANLEDNRDGHNHNLSDNYGVEGPSNDPDILEYRQRQQRNLLASLLLAHGTPMLLAGDEINHTQGGNNNAYCQDNEISWLNWNLDPAAESLLSFVKFMLALRKRIPVFQTNKFLTGELNDKLGYRDAEWYRPDGLPMSTDDWHKHFARCIVVLLTGSADGKAAATTRHSLIIFNAAYHAVYCVLPATPEGGRWQLLLDTNCWPAGSESIPTEDKELRVEARSTIVFTEVSTGESVSG